jgi:rhodanese-related sulfurtransferase
MGNINSVTQINKFNFDNMRDSIRDQHIIINTLPEDHQTCLITGTIQIEDEVKILNKCLSTQKDKTIIIYGKNNNDEKVITKYKQLVGLGFTNVYVYIGGIFEWLLLQEVYGEENFPTTMRELDILKYK